MRFFSTLGLLAAVGFLASGCQSKDKPAGDAAVVQPKPGDAIVSKLDAIVIPVVDFDNASAEEAIDFLRLRSLELDPDKEPSQRGVSFIVRRPRPIEKSGGEGSTGLNPYSVSLDYPVNYTAKSVRVLDALSEVARQGKLDAYLTSTGIVLVPEGESPFPNPKATEGEVWKVLRKSK
ncbi:MAG: hypothetical protein ABIS50_13645 [Luteolibacter sp.]|uniref:hypothetical protein n=1 Tax=Luteolibacter sp. TaxID=1962973 RepID=UPI0032666ED3